MFVLSGKDVIFLRDASIWNTKKQLLQKLNQAKPRKKISCYTD